MDFCSKPLSGMVYIMTNGEECNEVAAFSRRHDGTLSPHGLYKTGGRGTGPNPAVDPLVSQGSLILSRDGNMLFAVNAGSDSVSCFLVDQGGSLTLSDVKPSGGIRPNCLDAYGGLLYVGNAGSGGQGANITGFLLNGCGQMCMIPGSTRPLSLLTAMPARVLFNPCGTQLTVSEQNVNRLSVYGIHRDGTASLQRMNQSSGNGPFGSTIHSRMLLIVAEAGANALSSYVLCPNGDLHVISGSVTTGQNATCWVVHSADERSAYASNTGSGTISTFHIRENGTLTLMENTPSTPEGTQQGAPIDSGVSPDGRNFYVLNGNQGSVSAFAVDGSGKLFLLQTIHGPGIPESGVQGLAVR